MSPQKSGKGWAEIYVSQMAILGWANLHLRIAHKTLENGQKTIKTGREINKWNDSYSLRPGQFRSGQKGDE